MRAMMLAVLECGRGTANIPDGDNSLERPPPPKRWAELTNASQGKCLARQAPLKVGVKRHRGQRMVPGSRAKPPAVLIVEDEPLVRLCAVETVEGAGFEVIEAANADEAIRILESRSDIRVVFTA